MSSLSLLDRIDRGSPGSRGGGRESGETIESILDHLRRMLNTRQGHALVAPDYGMPDFTGFAQSPEARRAIQNAIWESIRRYEPRFKKVQINHLETDDLQLRFEIVATLASDSRNVPIRFETRVESSGLIHIE